MQDLLKKIKQKYLEKINRYQMNEILLIGIYKVTVTESVKTVSSFDVKNKQSAKLKKCFIVQKTHRRHNEGANKVQYD